MLRVRAWAVCTLYLCHPIWATPTLSLFCGSTRFHSGFGTISLRFTIRTATLPTAIWNWQVTSPSMILWPSSPMSRTVPFIIVTVTLRLLTGNARVQQLLWVQLPFFYNYKVYISDFTDIFPFAIIFQVLLILWPIFFLDVGISPMFNFFPILILTFRRSNHGAYATCGPRCIQR